jgi:hypothetical protein
MKKLRGIAFLAGLVGLLVDTAFGQQAGQIVGVVTDSTGGVVPGITITATEIGTGFSQSTVTGEDGRYVFRALRPTRYEIKVESSGFRAFRRVGIELLANQSLTVNVSLEVGVVTETVNVAAAAVQVDTTTSTLSEVVEVSTAFSSVVRSLAIEWIL